MEAAKIQFELSEIETKIYEIKKIQWLELIG